MLPIKIGEVAHAKTNIPTALNHGFAKVALINMALYKNPQGSKAVIIPKVAAFDRGEYLFMKIAIFCALFEKISIGLRRKNIWMKQIKTIIREIFFAERFKKSLNKRVPKYPEMSPIMV